MTYILSRSLRIAAPLCALPALFAWQASASQANVNTTPGNTIVALNSRKFDLSKPDQLDAFIKSVKDLDKVSKEERKDKKAEKKAEKKAKKDEKQDESAATDADAPESDTAATADTGKHPHKKAEADEQAANAAADEDDASDDNDAEVPVKPGKGQRNWGASKVQHGLKAMERIAEGIQDHSVDPAAGIAEIQEIDWAIDYNYVTPYTWRPVFDPFLDLFRVRAITLNACGRGSSKDPASNLITYDAQDLSKIDPKPSTFWSRPASISDKDLYTGFDRKAIPDFTDSVLQYAKAHSGYGIHPSFEVTWHGSTYKVKFGEEKSSGPFACRIFWALGFPSTPVDYTPEVKVTWDRHILSDFNKRQANAMELKILGIHVSTQHQHAYFNPFDFIKYAVLKDGTHVPSDQLRARLFPHPAGEKLPSEPEMNKALYDKKFEDEINYLVMDDASVTPKDIEGVQDLGYWDYNTFDHPQLRELRGMAVLNAWLDNWDIRWGNNRLELVKEGKGSYRLVHEVSDLGALFGNATGLIRRVHGRVKVRMFQNMPNDYDWTFTNPQPADKTCVPIKYYMPITKTQPFYRMNIDDARWMARLIARITEPQIKQALIGAGFDAAEARLLLEKLVSRRDRMIQDLGLSSEIPLLRPSGVNEKLTYNPAGDGPFEAARPDGQRVTARTSGEYTLVAGVLKENREGVPTNMALEHP